VTAEYPIDVGTAAPRPCRERRGSSQSLSNLPALIDDRPSGNHEPRNTEIVNCWKTHHTRSFLQIRLLYPRQITKPSRACGHPSPSDVDLGLHGATGGGLYLGGGRIRLSVEGLARGFRLGVRGARVFGPSRGGGNGRQPQTGALGHSDSLRRAIRFCPLLSRRIDDCVCAGP
jgi:hypothetical protein